MTNIIGLKSKTYSYLIDSSTKDKKANDTKSVPWIKQLKFENYKNCLEAIRAENKINHSEKIIKFK